VLSAPKPLEAFLKINIGGFHRKWLGFFDFVPHIIEAINQFLRMYHKPLIALYKHVAGNLDNHRLSYYIIKRIFQTLLHAIFNNVVISTPSNTCSVFAVSNLVSTAYGNTVNL
jgi:hypothetical protein